MGKYNNDVCVLQNSVAAKTYQPPPIPDKFEDIRNMRFVNVTMLNTCVCVCVHVLYVTEFS